MNLADKIDANRRKWALWRRAERVLRVTRQRMFDMEDAGLAWKTDRIVKNCKRILAPKWKAENDAVQRRKQAAKMRTWE
jgi:hypothetical protein